MFARMRSVILTCTLAWVAWAADPPPVADPLELGERLALIDHLQSAYGRTVAAGASLADLRSLYAEEWRRRQPADPTAQDRAGQADRVQRLRRTLADRYEVIPPTDASEADLLALLRTQDGARRSRDAEIIARKLAASEVAEPVTVTPAPVSAAPDPAPPIDAPVDPAETKAGQELALRIATSGLQPIDFPDKNIARGLIASDATHRGLVVIFGPDHNGAYRGIPERFWGILSASTTIRRGVLLLGHGTGVSIGGANLQDHLRQYRAYYETLGGTVVAQPVECLVLASCSEGNSSQMSEMRNGLGYYPTWRVATSPNAYATGSTVLGAFLAIAYRPSAPAWRGLFRLGEKGDDVGAFGEVGVDGERGSVNYLRILANGQVKEQR